jgi:hypothetical protein
MKFALEGFWPEITIRSFLISWRNNFKDRRKQTTKVAHTLESLNLLTHSNENLTSSAADLNYLFTNDGGSCYVALIATETDIAQTRIV